ncbi:MAG: lipopolysaccharide heptosyltransferase I [Gammaproteobacteria bacterium]|nr:lipopolysaccharide heptosyltransferase I [Gammaproteobacteria bacterium]
MTRILIVKTSSMGDIIHTLPALTDAARSLKDITFDWVVEEAFVEIPKWHPLVENIIQVPLRRFKKQKLHMIHNGEVALFFKQLRERQYDRVIDAQGLIKSALITRFSRGLRCGLDRKSAWEPLASLAYQKRLHVDASQHAITRMRQIFSQALDYPLVDSSPDYGIKIKTNYSTKNARYLLFIHGTTWETKEWPESYWIALAKIANDKNYEVLLPWGNIKEQERAQRIAKASNNVRVLEKSSLTEIAGILLSAAGTVSVDTGLGHLAAALNVPTVSIYGPTDPKETGALGANQKHLTVNFKCSPCWSERCKFKEVSSVAPACFASIPPEMVWNQLTKVIHD